MPITIDRPKWILYKHTNSYDMIRTIALLMKSMAANINEAERYVFMQKMETAGIYNPRNTKDLPLDSVNHRINTLEYFLFGYEDKIGKDRRFIFSPLGNLYLKYFEDKEKTTKIFSSMLFGIQFPTPANNTPSCFRLFPFRLLFKLMEDDRLGKKLYDTDYAYLVVFQTECTATTYEKLVADILNWRKLSPIEQFSTMKRDEHTYVNCIYEWAYYVKSILHQAGILNCHDGDLMGYLYHPTKTNSHSKPTKRKITTAYSSINPAIESFISNLLLHYSPFDTPLRLYDDPNRLEFDVKKQIYSFYPSELLPEIGEKAEIIQDLLHLVQLIEEYSKNPNNETEYLFEQVLTDGFNMFSNVEAQRVGGAGKSDIVCKFSGDTIEKFDVEAKSTSSKLTLINAGRLRSHREAVKGKYTIVITPQYVPAVKADIAGEPIVIILASTFSEYLYNNIYHGVRNIDYKDINDIILNNLGKDISLLVSNKTLEKFSTQSY